jgi:hypothetical protein
MVTDIYRNVIEKEIQNKLKYKYVSEEIQLMWSVKNLGTQWSRGPQEF